MIRLTGVNAIGVATPVDVGVVSKRCVEQVIDKAFKGDTRAKATMDLIFGWSNWAHTKATPPPCIVCKRDLNPNLLGGYVVMVPIQADDKRGIAAAFCKKCQRKRTSDQIREAFASAMQHDNLGQMGPRFREE